jgi:hypothetical protein
MRKISFLYKSALGALLLLAMIASFSCSQAAPKLLAVSLKLVYRQSALSIVERLSCFVLAEDEDGFADIEELRLVNDRAQLYWTLTSSDWLSVVKTGDTWVGSHSISMPEGMRFPRGQYRVVLVDKGGEKTERTVSFDPPAVSARAFPNLSISGGSYSVSSSYPKNLLVVYSASGALLRSVELPARSGKVAELGLGPNVRSVALWAEDEASSVAAFTEPVTVE